MDFLSQFACKFMKVYEAAKCTSY